MSGTGFDRVGLSFAAKSGSGVQELLATTSNVRGIILRTACIAHAGSTTADHAIYMGTSAPSGIYDMTKAQIMRGGHYNGSYTLTREIFIPPGNGLWAVAGTGNYVVYAWITYDEVPAK